MFKLLNPRWRAERCFLPDPEHEGAERFHPFGSLGQAYPVSDPELRSKLARFVRLYLVSGFIDLAVIAFWLGYYQKTSDRMMRFAPPLLMLAAFAMSYRVGIRAQLKGVAPTSNLWSGRDGVDDQPIGLLLLESMLMFAVLIGIGLFGNWLGLRT